MKAPSKYYAPTIAAIYAILYATVITIACMLLGRRPTILQMEYAVYDFVQKNKTIDTYSDRLRASQFLQIALDELFFINLDTTFFDTETDRIRRDKLASLLDELRQSNNHKTIFLDYLFDTPSSAPSRDSILIKSLQAIEQQIVLPYSLSVKEFDTKESDDQISPPNLLYNPTFNGYLDYRFFIDKIKVHRYVQAGKESDTRLSAIYALIKLLREKKSIRPSSEIPEVFEINYLLRNVPTQGQAAAVSWTDASKIVDQSIELPQQEKVIFIGLFDTYRNKYKSPLDQYETPVSEAMNGIYLIINSYLNAITHTHIRPVSIAFIFWSNFLLALLGILYGLFKKRNPNKTADKLIYLLLHLGLIAMPLLLYSYFFLKYPFVIPALFWVVNRPLFQALKNNFFSDRNPFEVPQLT